MAVAQHTSELDIVLEILDGATIEGYTALYQSNPQKNSADDIAKVSMNVTGGNFKVISGGSNAVYSENKTAFITGGSFSSDPTAYVADDYIASPIEGGEYFYMVGANKVAQIGGKSYSSLKDAIDDAGVGDTVKLTKDVTLTSKLTIGADKDIILDLNDNTLTLDAPGSRLLENKGTLTINGNGGKIAGTNTSANGLIDNHGTITANQVIFEDAGCGNGASIKNRPNDTAPSVLTLNQCSMKGTGVAVGNANVYSDGTLTINGGTFAAASTGAYAVICNSGTLTLNSTAQEPISVDGAKGALGINSGTATINGGTYNSGEYYGCWITNNKDSGTDVTISGGTFTGEKYGVYSKVDDGQQDAGDVRIKISGGNFAGATKGAAAVNTDDSVKAWSMSITGGYFTTDPSAYVADGYKATSGTWTIEAKPYSFKVAKVATNVIVSATAQVVNATDDSPTTEDAAVAIDGKILKVSGTISEGNKIVVTYTSTDGKIGTATITLDDKGKFIAPDDFKVGDTTYTVDVSTLTTLPAEIKVAAPEAAAKAVENPSDAAEKAAKQIGDAMVYTPPTASGLGTAVTGAALTTTNDKTTVTVGSGTGSISKTPAEVTDAAINNAVTPEALKEKFIEAQKPESQQSLVIVVQPVLNILVKDLTGGADEKVLELDISAQSQIVVTTSDVKTDKLITDTDKQNAVKVGTPVDVTVNEPVTLTIPLPTGFVVGGYEDSVFVQHEMHNGKTETVKAIYNSVSNTITFTINGMSPVSVIMDGSTCTINYPDEITTQYILSDADVTSLPTATQAGKSFAGWVLADADGKIIPDADGTYKTMTSALLKALNGKTVTATPVFTDIPSGGGGYSITVEDSKNGTVTSNMANASKGTTVTLTVDPKNGYKLDELTVTDKSDNEIEVTLKNGKYTFEMPGSAVTITATFIEGAETGLPFADVAASDWFFDAVYYAFENDIMNGVSDTLFAPSSATTRGMVATILYRLEGEPKAGSSDFKDVSEGMYYTDAISWAAENGIVAGYEDGTYRPNNNITREQVATILYRFASYKGYDVTKASALTSFSDADSVSEYAVAAMKWSVSAELIDGIDDTLQPNGKATRAQVATMMMRFCEYIAK